MMAYRNFKVLPNRVHMNPSETYQLSPEQVQFYNDNGYLVVKKLIPQDALDSYRQRFVEVCNGKVDRGHVTIVKDYALDKTSKPEDFINKIQDLLYDEVYSTYIEDPRLLHAISQLIGDELTAANGMLINKPPGTNMHAPHQDQFYLPLEPANKILVAWTAIDPARKDNGCLFMVPGSHKPQKLYVHNHDSEDGKKFFFTIHDWKTFAPEHKRVYLEMDPGDTVFVHSMIIHGSMPNTSQEYRKCMSCHYANSNCQYVDLNGTNQKLMTSLFEEIYKPRGVPTYLDMFKMKMKVVKGVKCNL